MNWIRRTKHSAHCKSVKTCGYDTFFFSFLLVYRDSPRIFSEFEFHHWFFHSPHSYPIKKRRRWKLLFFLHLNGIYRCMQQYHCIQSTTYYLDTLYIRVSTNTRTNSHTLKRTKVVIHTYYTYNSHMWRQCDGSYQPYLFTSNQIIHTNVAYIEAE